MGKTAILRSLLLRFKRSRTTVTSLFSCVGIVLLVAVPLHALDPNKRVTQYIHTSWRIQDGSLPAGMFSIAQTSDGFLWLSSFSRGIYRFDGVRIVPWSPSSTAGLINTQANVVGDGAGGLWIVTERNILHVKDGALVSSIELQGLDSASVSEDPDGSLWVARSSNSVTDAPLCHVTDRWMKCFGKTDGIPISPLDSLLADGKGGFWLGGQTTLVHWHGSTADLYPIGALKSNVGQHGIDSLAMTADGTLWVGILAAGPGLGLGRLLGGNVKPFVTPAFDGTKITVTKLLVDADGNLWVATAGKGILRIRGNVLEHYGRAEGLSSDATFTLFEDRERILWAATTNGIDSFRNPRVTTFSAAEGLGKDAVSSVLASKDGTIWVGNAESLDHIVNGKVSSIRTGSGLPGHQVTYMMEDRAGNLWIGVDDGLYLLKNRHFRRIPELHHRPLGMVIGMTEDTDGNVWAQCLSNPRKLVRIRDFQVREEFAAPQVPPGRVITADPKGGIWITTLNRELALFRNRTIQKFPLPPNSQPARHQIIAEPDGSVLAASEDGLITLRQGTVQRMTAKNGLPCNAVFSFIEDREKRWWLYTQCGVVELPDSELQKWWASPETIVQTRLYGVLEGAQPNAPSFTSAAYSQDGRVWFANGVDLQMVDPSELSQKTLPAETYIESVVADRREFEAKPNLNLPPNPRDLQIDYTSPTFSIPQKVKFRYRLDGYDREWHEASTRRQAFYTDLPPGKYSFLASTSNSDGVWDDTPAKLDFSIGPAYYQTNWFRALCACVFLALLWAAYQWRVRQLQHQFDMTLDARVNERTRIARDLHDTLLQSAHGLLLRFQTVSQLLPDRPIEAKDKLDSAIDQTAGFITEARDEVQGLRGSTTQGNDLALAITTLGEELAADSTDHRPAFRVAVEGRARDLHPILRDEIYKIAAEALRNAFRHAQAPQIEVEIRYDNEQFRLRVRDDGKGIDPAHLCSLGVEGHYGLPGMRERAKLVGAKLTIWSEVNTGTEIEVRISANAAYAAAQKRSWLSRKAKA